MLNTVIKCHDTVITWIDTGITHHSTVMALETHIITLSWHWHHISKHCNHRCIVSLYLTYCDITIKNSVTALVLRGTVITVNTSHYYHYMWNYCYPISFINWIFKTYFFYLSIAVDSYFIFNRIANFLAFSFVDTAFQDTIQ